MNSIKKLFIIPGFLRPIKFYNWCEGIEVWANGEDVENKIEAEYIVGYSLGAVGALLNWKKHRNAKIILINPLFPRRSLINWLWRWIKFILFEGAKPRQAVNVKKFISGARRALVWLRVDALSILQEVPAREVMIFRGNFDNFFFDKSVANQLRQAGFNIIEIDGVGHDWDEKIKSEVEKYLN